MDPDEDGLDAAFASLIELHAEVDQEAQALADRHSDRLRCGRGCSDCCVDDLSVFEIEAERIRRNHPQLLAEGRPGEVGGCAFLDDQGGCRIYADRPYVCRTQGLPLRWLSESPQGDIEERRDICPLNLDGPPLNDIREEDVWLIGPIENRLAVLQDSLDGGKMLRTFLRSLFAKQPSSR